MTKEELDDALFKVRYPAPVILVGPLHPITTFEGWNDPFDGWYRGVRVVEHAGLADTAQVVDSPPSPY